MAIPHRSSSPSFASTCAASPSVAYIRYVRGSGATKDWAVTAEPLTMEIVSVRRPDSKVAGGGEQVPVRPIARPPSANDELVGQLARGSERNPVFDPTAELVELETSFERCLAGLAMHFQPIVHAKSRARFGYE